MDDPRDVPSPEPECWFCDDTVRELPPTGWLIDDDTWRAGAAPAAMSIPGTVILETRRHVLDQAGFTAAEIAAYAGVLGRLLNAVRAATGCDRVYQWASMDAYPHFHLWLLPWWTTSELRGPRYLASSVYGGASHPDATAAMATKIDDHFASR